VSFEKIAGQDSLVQALKIALAKNRLAHALLFTGPSKCGQRAVAMELAKALFCRNPGENGGCDGCHEIFRCHIFFDGFCAFAQTLKKLG